MNKLCDLHTHSTYSDGTCTPAELIALAQDADLAAIALCDHNTVDGLPDFVAAARNSPVEAVCGVEFSVDYRGKELHLLGLFVQPQHHDSIRALLAEGIRLKEESNLSLIAKLNSLGYPLDYKAMKAATPSGQINRAHIAAALTQAGYTASVKEAFSRLLSTKRGLYQPPSRPDVFRVIDLLRSMELAAVLAHPFLNLSRSELPEFLAEAKHHGLVGMETEYPLFSPEETLLARQLADEFGLLHSGGSDFHGTNKPDIRIGTGKGNLRIPLRLLDNLKESLHFTEKSENIW